MHLWFFKYLWWIDSDDNNAMKIAKFFCLIGIPFEEKLSIASLRGLASSFLIIDLIFFFAFFVSLSSYFKKNETIYIQIHIRNWEPMKYWKNTEKCRFPSSIPINIITIQQNSGTRCVIEQVIFNKNRLWCCKYLRAQKLPFN